MSAIGGLGNPNAVCCNCWCEELLKQKIRRTKKRIVAMKSDQMYQARQIHKMSKIIDDLKMIIDDLKRKVETRPELHKVVE
ncbi:hypothetical protein EJB05_26948, partial [Eragrostis curvula]